MFVFSVDPKRAITKKRIWKNNKGGNWQKMASYKTWTRRTQFGVKGYDKGKISVNSLIYPQ